MCTHTVMSNSSAATYNAYTYTCTYSYMFMCTHTVMSNSSEATYNAHTYTCLPTALRNTRTSSAPTYNIPVHTCIHKHLPTYRPTQHTHTSSAATYNAYTYTRTNIHAHACLQTYATHIHNSDVEREGEKKTEKYESVDPAAKCEELPFCR